MICPRNASMWSPTEAGSSTSVAKTTLPVPGASSATAASATSAAIDARRASRLTLQTSIDGQPNRTCLAATRGRTFREARVRRVFIDPAGWLELAVGLYRRRNGAVVHTCGSGVLAVDPFAAAVQQYLGLLLQQLLCRGRHSDRIVGRRRLSYRRHRLQGEVPILVLDRIAVVIALVIDEGAAVGFDVGVQRDVGPHLEFGKFNMKNILHISRCSRNAKLPTAGRHRAWGITATGRRNRHAIGFAGESTPRILVDIECQDGVWPKAIATSAIGGGRVPVWP